MIISMRGSPLTIWSIGLIALALCAAASGCLARAVPSLAYQGYKYEQKSSTQSGSARRSENSNSARDLSSAGNEE
jgi:hypothetical protein